MIPSAKGYMNPYLAGILLGVVLFGSFLVFGHGLGASGGVAVLTGAATDLVAPGHVEDNGYGRTECSEEGESS